MIRLANSVATLTILTELAHSSESLTCNPFYAVTHVCSDILLAGVSYLLFTRHLHELCEWGAKEGLNRLRTILKVQYRMCHQLHSNVSYLPHSCCQQPSRRGFCFSIRLSQRVTCNLSNFATCPLLEELGPLLPLHRLQTHALLFVLQHTTLFFYENLFYTSIEAEIC